MILGSYIEHFEVYELKLTKGWNTDWYWIFWKYRDENDRDQK